MDYSQNNL